MKSELDLNNQAPEASDGMAVETVTGQPKSSSSVESSADTPSMAPRPSKRHKRPAPRLLKRATTSAKAKTNLVKRSQRAPNQAQIDPAPTSNRPANTTRSTNLDLPIKTINAIFLKSGTIPIFAANLMVHLFDESELIECQNVIKSDGKDGLDEARLALIHQLVKNKTTGNVWGNCLTSMKARIKSIKCSRSRKLR